MSEYGDQNDVSFSYSSVTKIPEVASRNDSYKQIILQEKILERHLLKLMDFSESDGRQECNVQVDIGDVFSWIVKFRKSGVIVNNR